MAEPRRLDALANSLAGQAAVVVGNGESRLAYDLSTLRSELRVFGCNALYRDFIPHFLGAVDIEMTNEIVRAVARQPYVFIGPEGRIQQWVQAERDPGGLIVAELEPDWTTGPMVLRAAAVLGCDPIYLLGFDVAWTPRESIVNSVYKDTARYAPSDSGPSRCIPRWEQQLDSVLRAFESRTFLQVGPRTLPVPGADWEDLL